METGSEMTPSLAPIVPKDALVSSFIPNHRLLLKGTGQEEDGDSVAAAKTTFWISDHVSQSFVSFLFFLFLSPSS
jgi:TctA family transporter